LTEYPAPQGLYDSRNEHDSCGVGFVAHIKGEKSHAIVSQALEILANLDHRGAVGADPLLGDGAGILIQMPDPLYRKWAEGEGLTLPPPGDYAVAMCFMPQNDEARDFITGQFEKFIAKEGQRLIGWRDVPTTEDGLGKAVLASMPMIRQCFIARGENCADQDAFACRRSPSSTCRASPAAPWSTRACCWRTRSAASTTTCAIPIAPAPWASCTSASAPTLSPAGGSPSRSG
jgi:glutamate synthase (NADPH/NADH) large chain